MGIGAQFGGKYFCHDIRVIRLPRHGASCPVGLGVSCSADRQVWGKINRDGVFLEQLEEEPSKYLPEVTDGDEALSEEVVKVDLNQPMKEIRKELSKYPIATRLSLSGTIIVARDIAHAKILERLEKGEEVSGRGGGRGWGGGWGGRRRRASPFLLLPFFPPLPRSHKFPTLHRVTPLLDHCPAPFVKFSTSQNLP